ncbi:type II toxin-antitoxin system HicA family toxin [Ralstonia solanacearum]|uniref:type II toxin-antitoxin system HicA family toxin n=1 Tax=Ralstonia solanacearum TaxID=305 RepID=UPI00168BBA0F|nr:type II toxin-antitoxin system HicA family toxin [Ralstonia solanacearum]QNT25524.1 type II toxin-antitoxin system HicA family toxin [Ralstonia solanacearum]QNT63163.1 type II toxin-antitoxin system HicA family toxin [Ralstonia solanacearum]
MLSRHHPLTCKDVKQILKNLGFNFRDQNGSSHEQWVRKDDRGFYKVTVDCPKAPFSQTLITFMARQAGVSKKEFYAALHSKEESPLASPPDPAQPLK